MAYEPQLITPFEDSGLVKYYKPFLVGKAAFPDIQNAYPWRGSVRKREGFSIFGTLPTSPVQGLKNWINPSTLVQSLIGFSTTKSYLWNTGTSLFNDITFLAFGGPGQTNANQAFSWSNGTNDYFWTSNYAASMWTTNNLTADHIRFWNGTPAGGWSIHQPTVNGTTTLDAGLIILPYRGRLVVLNTSEGGNPFPQRARWCQIGTPYTSNSAGVSITNITAAANAVVSVGVTTSFTIGQKVGITGVVGSMGPVLNFNQFNVVAINPGVSVTISASTTGLTYTSGGTIQGTGSTSPPSPFTIDIFGWRDDIPGRGGFVDADTSERIVSAEIVRDTLIVAFQRSTWRLRYTGNEILPFVWERLNTQYGAESTYSNVAFDEAALFFSRYGFIGSTTNDVARIDENIPDDSFAIEAVDSSFTGLSRVQAIRDYYRQMAYWTIESVSSTTASNQIYAYNYLDKSWAIFTPTVPIKTFGYFFNSSDLTWSTFNISPKHRWRRFNSDDDIWENFGSGQNTGFPFIIGGDANGNVYQMFEFFQNPAVDAGGTGSEANFNFSISTKTFNPYLPQGLKARVGYVDIYCTTNVGGEITLEHFVDDQQSPILTKTVEIFSRGVLAITAITPGTTTTITTATPHNLPSDIATQVSISDIYGSIGTALNNTTPLATFVSSTSFTVPIDTSGKTYTSGGFVWKGGFDNGLAKYVRVYLGPIAHMHQFVLTLSPSQLSDPIKGTAQFEMQALLVWTKPVGRIRG